MHVQCTLVLFLAFTAVVMLEAPKGAKPLCEAGKSYSYHTIGICTNISICPFFNRANSPPGTISVRPSSHNIPYRLSGSSCLYGYPTKKFPHAREKKSTHCLLSLSRQQRAAGWRLWRGEERRALDDNCERESGGERPPIYGSLSEKNKMSVPK